MRAPVRSADDAIAVLGKIVLAGLSAARRRGQLSHALFVRPANVVAGRPASNARRGPGESLAAPAGPTVITLWGVGSLARSPRLVLRWSRLPGPARHLPSWPPPARTSGPRSRMRPTRR